MIGMLRSLLGFKKERGAGADAPEDSPPTRKIGRRPTDSRSCIAGIQVLQARASVPFRLCCRERRQGCRGRLANRSDDFSRPLVPNLGKPVVGWPAGAGEYLPVFVGNRVMQYEYRVIRSFCDLLPQGYCSGFRTLDASCSAGRGEFIGGADGPPVRPG